MIPFSFFNINKTTERNIIVTLDGTPTTFDITKSIVRFDKDFAFSWSLDDSLGDAALIANPAFNGGNVIEKDGTHLNYPGLAYTDGCGNDENFNFEMKIIGSWITNDEYSDHFINYRDLRKIYVEGCGYENHSLTHKDLDEQFSSDPDIKEQELIDEIIDNYELIKTNTGIRTKGFTPPSNYAPYFGVAYQLYLQNKLKRVAYMRPDISTTERQNYDNTTYSMEFYSTLTDIGSGGVRNFTEWQDSTITDTEADMSFIEEHLSATTENNHYWFNAASHALGVGYGTGDTVVNMGFRWLSFKAFFERLENTYGRYGSDNIWMENEGNVWEYIQCWKHTNIDVLDLDNVNKNIKIDFSDCDNEFRYHRLSFVISTDVNVTNIEFSGYTKTSYQINHKSLGNGNVLVNVEYMPLYESALFRRLNSLVLVENFEISRIEDDKTIAQNAVDLLNNGEYKSTLQGRIDAVELVPESQTILIDVGTDIATYPTPAPWNNLVVANGTSPIVTGTGIDNLINTLSEATDFGIHVTEPFDDAGSSGASDDGNLLYPYSAHRDAFRINGGAYAELTITGLSTSNTYDVKLYASRAFIPCVQKYTVNGEIQTFDIDDNRTTTVDFTDITGVSEIVIGIQGNDSGTVGHINVIELIER